MPTAENPGLSSHTLVHWQMLQDSYRRILSGKVSQALRQFETLLSKDLNALYANPNHPTGWHITDAATPAQPSMNWLIALLVPYQYQYRSWRRWFPIAERVLLYADEIAPACRAQITAGMGVAYLTDAPTRMPLETVIEQQQQALPDAADDLARSVHHLVIGHAYRNLRQTEPALQHMQTAIALAKASGSAFWEIYAEEHLGAIHYFLNDLSDDPVAAYERADAIYHDLESKARAINDDVDFVTQSYNLGWSTTERGDLAAALYHFKRGLVEAATHLSDTDVAMYHYGLGYVYLLLEQDETAQQHLEQAVAIASRQQDPLRIAVSLDHLATIFMKRGDFARALDRAQYGVHYIQQIDNPLQMMHLYRKLTLVYRAMRGWWPSYAMLVALFHTMRLKIKLRKPLLPF